MKQRIIERLANEKTIRTIIQNVAKDSNDPDLDDLEQDIMLELLEKDEELIDSLDEKGQLNYFITRMVMNNIMSKTSRFYYMYKKDNLKNVPIDEYKETADNKD